MTTTTMNKNQTKTIVDPDVERGYCQNFNSSSASTHRVIMNKIPYSSFKNYFCYVAKNEKTNFPLFKYGKFLSKSENIPNEASFIKHKEEINKLSRSDPEYANQVEKIVGSENMKTIEKPYAYFLYDDFSICFDEINCKGPYHPFDRTSKVNGKEFNSGPDVATFNFSVSNNTNPDMLKNMYHQRGMSLAGNLHYQFLSASMGGSCKHSNLLRSSKTFILVPVTFEQYDEDGKSQIITVDTLQPLYFDDTGRISIMTINEIMAKNDAASDVAKSYKDLLGSLCGRVVNAPIPGSSRGIRSLYCFNESALKPVQEKVEYVTVELLPSKGNTKRVKQASERGGVIKPATTPEEMEKMKSANYWQTNKFFLGIKNESNSWETLIFAGKHKMWFTFSEGVRKGTVKGLESETSFWLSLLENRSEYANIPVAKLSQPSQDKSHGFVGSVNIAVTSVGSTNSSNFKCHYSSKTVLVLPVSYNESSNDSSVVPSFELKFTVKNPMEDDVVKFHEDNEDDVFPE